MKLAQSVNWRRPQLRSLLIVLGSIQAAFLRFFRFRIFRGFGVILIGSRVSAFSLPCSSTRYAAAELRRKWTGDRQRDSKNSVGSSVIQPGPEPRPAVFHDPRLQFVEWRDLVSVRRFEVFTEPLLPAAWLAASLVLAGFGHFVLALGFSFFFFLTGLRVVHNAFHCSLGLSRRSTDIVLWIMSLVMLGSMHAVQFNHLRHHKLNLGQGDVEGRSAEMPAWRALLFGPLFPILLHVTAFRHGNKRLRKIVAAELLLSAVWVFVVFGALHSGVLRYHVGAMLVGQCMTAFFAVWTVHHHCDRTHHLARTLHNRLKNWITFNMFLHIEHHLFPRVPTCHLPELSRRIDRVAPDLRSKIVF